MDEPNPPTLISIGKLFFLGGAITALFSSSLAMQAAHAGWLEVLVVGMVVPSFTWVVHLVASALLLPRQVRMLYWDDLGRICFLGSVALLPAAAFNFFIAGTPLWISAANVLISVAVMATTLFKLTDRDGISRGWPVSWCATITVNMMLFLWSSRSWW